MNDRGRLALVTGAAGFIGSHLVEALVRDNWRVRCFVRYDSSGSLGFIDTFPAEVRESLDVRRSDLLDETAVDAATEGVDTVFHLGARISIPYSYASPRDNFMVNAVGTLNVLEAARTHRLRRVVHTSTSEVFGSAQTVPMPESHPLQAQSPYAASKIAADKLVQSYHRSFGVPAVTVRPFNTYGPRQSPRAVIPAVIQQALAGTPIRLGALSPRRDLTFVADTVAGFLCAAEADEVEGMEFNLGAGEDIAIGDLARQILKAMELDLPIETDGDRMRPANSEVSRLCSDNRLARERLGWRPTTSLDEGLAATIAWWRENQDRFPKNGYAT
ncbi:MAG: NAD-dependent epimerase/dehydratase family protein [Bauldia sp.]|nr:MAG: NAD-dependent epimerase/dehydratase family protein [Bauldia sp.]MBZ0230355.1 GDP-mannose 4,6-dehydratase [Bauldia sp.]